MISAPVLYTWIFKVSILITSLTSKALSSFTKSERRNHDLVKVSHKVKTTEVTCRK